MGSVLRLTAETSEVGHVPRPFSRALLEKAFHRTLPPGPLRTFAKSALDAEKAETEAVTGGAIALEALRRLEAFVQDDDARKSANAGLAPDSSDLVFLRTTRRPRIHEARIRTGFIEPGRAWNERITGHITANDAWRDLSEGEPRHRVLAMFRAPQLRPDGSIHCDGHAAHGRIPCARENRFESKERRIELSFVPPHEHPDWRALLVYVEAHSTERYRFTAW